jgi:hypothetical protein
MIAKKLAPAKTGVADFSAWIMGKIQAALYDSPHNERGLIMTPHFSIRAVAD